MKVLIIGGTGLISRGVIKHLLGRGAEVTMLNRSQLENPFGPEVRSITLDRNEVEKFESTFADKDYDVVIDMICFRPEQAESDIRAFSGRCEQFIFCSTVCTYGAKIPPRVLITEDFPQEPVSEYGRNKVACERLFLGAHENDAFNATIVRPSHTYGPGHPLIDQLEFNTPAWDRVAKGRPVLCAGDGLGLWQSTHRDDVGRLFAYACLNPKTYGQAYNATRDEVLTWRDYYRQAAAALDATAELLFVPADWIIKHDPKRFGLLREITRFHGAYDSSKAKADIPEFAAGNMGLVEGAKETFAELRRRDRWPDSDADGLYNQMVERALGLGVSAVVA